ncbi:MAG: alkaline phosphatase family protein [Acidimicrobiales bacterium]|jgi:predicted AlkP superfamily pyrophosphatase or phosphodiesterase|nr:alkaline phosphatase family protein [Acidimicrobiales bacterium]
MTAADDVLVLPDYGGDCLTEIIPAILGSQELGPDSIMDAAIADAPAVVVLVLDGLGWNQLQDRSSVAPTLAELAGGRITTVAPSTTATALTSISTGTTPGVHGVVGYRIDVGGEVLNTLRWTTPRGDARERIGPGVFQPEPAFLGQRPVVVTMAGFEGTGFTMAHLADVRHDGWYTLPGIAVTVRQAVASGEPFVYAYYDGIDKTAHVHGFGEHYDAELAACDRMVADLMMSLPRGTSLVITADHGVVDCAGQAVALDPGLTRHIDRQSGEARFRWLHAEPGHARDLVAAAADAHSDTAWVRSVEQVIDEGWFGPTVSDDARGRLGDVALVAKERWYFLDPGDAPRTELIGRHGSLTPDEMYVPLLTYAG